MIFYFTATGNSLYAASLLEEERVSIPQVMWQDDLTFTDARIGIVAPVYGHEVPQMVREFMTRAVFHTDYFYMILTYGNRHGGAAELAQKLCAECGIDPAYINVVLMADNWLPAFDMEEQKRLDKQVEAQLSVIRADLDAGRCLAAPHPDQGWLRGLRRLHACLPFCFLACGAGKSGLYAGQLPGMPGLRACLPAQGHRDEHSGEESGRALPQSAYLAAADRGSQRSGRMRRPAHAGPFPVRGVYYFKTFF